MTDLTLSARRELRFVRNAVSAAIVDGKPGGWLRSEDLETLIDFLSAQWGCLDDLRGEDRWLDSLPPEPLEASQAELRALLEALMHTNLPRKVGVGLSVSLRRTEALAAAYDAQTAKARKNPDPGLLQQIQEHQKALEETREALLAADLQINGPVPKLSPERASSGATPEAAAA